MRRKRGRVRDCISHLTVQESVNMEQMYHDLENSFYELQKSMKSLKEGNEHLSTELDEERKKSVELEVVVLFCAEA